MHGSLAYPSLASFLQNFWMDKMSPALEKHGAN
jgi:hypothetical protein